MTTFSNLLRLTFQETGENDGTWGDVANSGVFQLLEDAIAQTVAVDVAAGDVTLTTVNGATDQARAAVLNITGAPGATRTVFVPASSKVYLVRNSTTGSQTINVRVVGGGGAAVTVIDNALNFIYCDGTDCLQTTIDTAVNAINATTATNATQLGGVAAASYARLDVQQTFTAGQASTPGTLTIVAGNVAVDASVSNTFILNPANANFTLNNPTSGLNGQAIRIAIVQDATGGRVITWGTAYRFPGGVQPTLSTAANAVDYFGFEFLQGVGGGIWVGNGLKDLS